MKRGNVKAGFAGKRAVSELSRSLKYNFISFSSPVKRNGKEALVL